MRADSGPGSIVDILAYEVGSAFRQPGAPAKAIRDDVVTRLFSCASGREGIDPMVAAWQQLQPELQKQEAREREIIAISRSNFVDLSKTRVVDWLAGQLRAPADAEKRLAVLSERLAKDIRERGDKRIPDGGRSSTQFMDTVRAAAAAIFKDTSNPAMQILQAQGILPSDLTPEMTMGEICDLATFRSKLRVANESLGLPWPELISAVSEGQLPSCVIQSGLRRYGQDPAERKGSELTDRYLACLSPYADVTYVDKRTHENFKRASRQSPDFVALVRRVEKASDYQEIGRQLAKTFQNV
jgi:hypothetical protein